MQTPQELLNELDGIPPPPEVSDLLDGSGVLESYNNLPCSEVDCSLIAALLQQVQTWLDQAKARLNELNAYTQRDDLQRIRQEAQLGEREAENNLGAEESDGTGYGDVVSAVNERLEQAHQGWDKLAAQRLTESTSKNLLQGTHNHCCVEPSWWHFFF